MGSQYLRDSDREERRGREIYLLLKISGIWVSERNEREKMGIKDMLVF